MVHSESDGYQAFWAFFYKKIKLIEVARNELRLKGTFGNM